MRTAGVAELKTRLSSYLKLVKSGSEILITDRGMPIAKLVPIDAARRKDTRRQRLAAAGVLTLGKGPLPKTLREVPKGDPSAGEGVLAALLAEREEGR
ncbi:MAG: type II toxin-antitoxin system Phd/YefM family antitoxin [Vicinamibacteria bacterium]